MKATINRDALESAITAAARVAAMGQTEIQACLYIEASKDSLIVEATDLNVSVRTVENAFIDEEGAVCVPAQKLLALVKALPDAAVYLESGDGALNIECDGRYSLNALDTDGYIAFGEVSDGVEIALEPSEFMAALKRAMAFVDTKSGARECLKGICLHSDGDTLDIVGTDSYRMFIESIELVGAPEFECVITRQFAQDVCGISNPMDTLKLRISDTKASADFGFTVLTTRLIAESYPRYRQVLGTDSGITAKLDVAALSKLVKRASAIDPNTFVSLAFSGEDVQMTANTPNGKMASSMQGDIIGETDEVYSVNMRYLADLLSVARDTGNIIAFHLNGNVKPIRYTLSEDCTGILMPVRLPNG